MYGPVIVRSLVSPSGLDEAVLEECLQYLERQLESSQVRKAMEEFFSFRWVSCPVFSWEILLILDLLGPILKFWF